MESWIGRKYRNLGVVVAAVVAAACVLVVVVVVAFAVWSPRPEDGSTESHLYRRRW